jgi:hypothetical protein
MEIQPVRSTLVRCGMSYISTYADFIPQAVFSPTTTTLNVFLPLALLEFQPLRASPPRDQR